MNIKKIISAATAAFIVIASGTAAYAGPKNDGKKKKRVYTSFFVLCKYSVNLFFAS